MEREIIVEIYPWESRVAIVENGRLAEIFWADQNDNVGNIYKGRVKDIIPGLSCAFIDIGLAKNAFLYKGDIIVPGLKRGSNIFDLLKSGQDIMVQVKKEAFSDKGARVTGNMTIPGHYLVLLPFQNEVSISRKITNNDRREYLRTIIDLYKPANMGVIVRTACMEAKDEELVSELHELLQVWLEIKERYDRARTPSLIYEDIDTLERTLREYLDVEISRIIINNRKLKDRISTYVDKKNASCREIIYEEGALFEKYSLEKDVKRTLRRKVWLKNGGYLIIDETEAMTVIDVNSGKYTGKDDFEDTVFKLNMEAAREIPRQLRLRSIGGIVLIDFVDMKNKENEEEVISTLRTKLAKDKANTRIVGMTGLGFLEMTRKKSRYGVSEFFADDCTHCNGRGRTINLAAVCCEIKRKLINMDYIEHDEIICEADPELIKVLSEDKADLDYIEKRIGKKLKLTSKSKYGTAEYNIFTSSY
ncbi:cytoplasmic axial filament protein cafa and ribonuclease g [hydrocarbon metagenome]|uniref:Cytoplasmic axial filament protein cafa and ribonuclease g n=1 Tax=hydrocarbon metagenome TaxID=938273 RepID=A0A0W8E6P3_9ZZZZ